MAFARPFTLAICALILGVTLPAAQALQLGETQAEIVARHGAPGAEDRGKKLAIYFWEGWSAQLEFQEGRVRKLTYRRGEHLQDAEVRSLLQSNGGMERWSEVSPAGARMREWQRDDGATASCDTTRPVSIVFQGGRGLSGVDAAATVQIGPKVVVPSAPPAESATLPNFPKLLGEVKDREPEPPAAEVPAAKPKPETSEEPTPESPATARETALGSPAVSEPPALPEAPGSSPVAEPAKGNGFLLGLLALAGVGTGVGLYFYKREGPLMTGLKKRFAAPTRDLPGRTATPASAFDHLRADQFELLVGEIFRREGYTVELSAATALDETIDLTLRRDGETILVECRHWQVTRVTARELRAFYGAMTGSGAPRGIFVTTGVFTRDACEFAEGKGIELMDRKALEECTTMGARSGENLADVSSWIDEFAASARIFDPECPMCQGTMVLRSSRAGGTSFWGCRQHPRCPGRREPRRDLLAVTASN